jgi:hypothetical protein
MRILASAVGVIALAAVLVATANADATSSANWRPTVSIAIPSTTVGGSYSGTIRQSAA